MSERAQKYSLAKRQRPRSGSGKPELPAGRDTAPAPPSALAAAPAAASASAVCSTIVIPDWNQGTMVAPIHTPAKSASRVWRKVRARAMARSGGSNANGR